MILRKWPPGLRKALRIPCSISTEIPQSSRIENQLLGAFNGPGCELSTLPFFAATSKVFKRREEIDAIVALDFSTSQLFPRLSVFARKAPILSLSASHASRDVSRPSAGTLLRFSKNGSKYGLQMLNRQPVAKYFALDKSPEYPSFNGFGFFLHSSPFFLLVPECRS